MIIRSDKTSWSIWIKIGIGVLLLIALMAINFIYMIWEVSEIKSLCKEATPGTPISEMRSLISKHGGYWDKNGSIKLKNEQEMWMVKICAKSTMCEASCKIYHNNTEVIEAPRATNNAESTIHETTKEFSETIIPFEKYNEKIFTPVDAKWLEETVYPSALPAMNCINYKYDAFKDDRERINWIKRIAPIFQAKLGSNKEKSEKEALILHYESVRQGLDPYLVVAIFNLVGTPIDKRNKALVGPIPIDRSIVQAIKRRAIEESDTLCFDFNELINSARIVTTLLRGLIGVNNGNLLLALRAYATYGMKMSPREIDSFPEEVKKSWQSILR